MKDTTKHRAAQIRGRIGGLSQSPAKRAASAANGRLGGRPRKDAPHTRPQPSAVLMSPGVAMFVFLV